jgi:thiamine biosynthesis lipoprotein
VNRAGVRAEPLLGTVVTIRVVGHDETPDEVVAREAAIDRAFGWCRTVHATCSRFEPESELSRLSKTVDQPVEVSELVFRALEFAVALAEETGGAFDPTVGAALAARGFDRHFLSGERIEAVADGGATYRDIELDPATKTVTLRRPMQLDLGAVAKGLAIDLAARELVAMENFAVDAGGDLYLGGLNPSGEPWTVGVRHPREEGALIGRVRVRDQAVCTSGDYERQGTDGSHHLLDPATGTSACALASVTVLAPTALVADGLSTAAFVLGWEAGAALLERAGVDGLLISPELAQTAVGEMSHAFLPYA